MSHGGGRRAMARQLIDELPALRSTTSGCARPTTGRLLVGAARRLVHGGPTATSSRPLFFPAANRLLSGARHRQRRRDGGAVPLYLRGQFILEEGFRWRT